MFNNLNKLKKAIGIKVKKQARSPTLDTILMVEGFIKDNSGGYRKTEVFNKLPRKVMWQTFQAVMNYLEENFRIVYDINGYVVYIWLSRLFDENIQKKIEYTKGERNLEEIKKIVKPILKKHGVTKAGIFGSFARGENDPFSDVDILVEMPKETDYFDLLFALEAELGRKVDIVEYSLIRKEIKENVMQEEVPISL